MFAKLTSMSIFQYDKLMDADVFPDDYDFDNEDEDDDDEDSDYPDEFNDKVKK